MKVSVQWAQHYANINLLPAGGITELTDVIGSQLGAVEEVIDLNDRYKGIVIAKVMQVDKHPDADKLHICKVADSRVVQGVERDDNGYVTIVTGAPNIRTGLMVVWLPPGVTVPSTYDDDEPFVLSSRPLRGVISHGMLASARELGIGDDHHGILELDTDNPVKPGDNFATAFHLDDTIIDIENKMFTHRPDCFGQLGVAREIAGITHQAFTSPDWYTTAVAIDQPGAVKLAVKVDNQLPDLVPRFTAIAIAGVQVKPSPFWLQTYLARVGIRPINNIVDLTNYFMMLTGQPLHAYDYDKLRTLDASNTATLTIRHPQEGETIALLNGKTIAPRTDAIMIASAKKLVGVGGIMGGSETEVDQQTTNIVLECATFDLYSVRRTSMAHGLFTDAVTRFSKGQSPRQNKHILAKTVADVLRLAGGSVASDCVDDMHTLGDSSVVHTSAQFVNKRLGLELSANDMATLLTNVEFAVTVQDDELTITAPFWRTDIAIPEDIVEEVGRLYGYDRLPLVLPKRDLTPPLRNRMLDLKAHIRSVLSAAGANEILTYSFVHGDLLAKVGQDTTQAFKLSNALSPDLQYYRLSLTPSLLDKVHANIKAGHGQFGLFEMGKVHNKQVINPDDSLPHELYRLSLVFAADQKTAERLYHGAPYYQALQYLQTVLRACGIEHAVRIEPLVPDTYKDATLQKVAMLEPSRSAMVVIGDKVLGEVGEYRVSVRRNLKLPDFCAGFELDLNLLQTESNLTSSYTPLPRFPEAEQDISFKLPAATPYAALEQLIDTQLAAAATEHGYRIMAVETIDIYQSPQAPNHKHVTVRLTLTHPERTLVTDEVNTLLDAIAQTAAAQLKAERL